MIIILQYLTLKVILVKALVVVTESCSYLFPGRLLKMDFNLWFFISTNKTTYLLPNHFENDELHYSKSTIFQGLIKMEHLWGQSTLCLFGLFSSWRAWCSKQYDIVINYKHVLSYTQYMWRNFTLFWCTGIHNEDLLS